MFGAKRKSGDDGPPQPGNAAKRLRSTPPPSGSPAAPAAAAPGHYVTRFWFAGRRASRLRQALASVRSRWYGRLSGVRVTPDDEEDGRVMSVRTRDAAGAVPVAWALWRELHAGRPDEDAARRERRLRRRGAEWTIRVIVDAAVARAAVKRDGGGDGVEVHSYKRARRGQSMVKIHGAARDAVRRLSRVLAAAAECGRGPSPSPSPPPSGRSITAADFGEWPVDAMTSTAAAAAVTTPPSPPRSPVPSTSRQGVRAADQPPVTGTTARVITAADYGEWPSDDDD